jgi:hypothetical protein
MSSEIDQKTATRFLLGELAEDERERLERRLLEDGPAGDAVAAAEDDLLDAWAAGELPRGQRLAFERRLRGSASLRRRAAFARALARAVRGDARAAVAADDPPAGVVVPGPGLRRAVAAPLAGLAAAASLILALACGWLLWRGQALSERVADLQREAQELAAERDALATASGELDRRLASERAAAAEIEAALAQKERRLAELESELARRRAAPPRAPLTASFVLSAALRSEIGSRRLELPPGVERVRLTLDLGAEEDFASYLAVVTGPAGAEVWSQRGLPPAAGAAGTAVELDLPAAVLADGRHEALLYGEPETAGGAHELVGAFEFEPVRR